MPIRARCSCGREEVYPDSLEGKEMRCRKCRQRMTVAGEKFRDPHAVPWTRRLIVLGLAIGGAIGAFTVVMYVFNPKQFSSVCEVYEIGSGAAVDPKVDDPRIRTVIQAAADAMTERKVADFAGQFHFRRMLAEVEMRGGLHAITTKAAEETVLSELDPALRTWCGEQYDGGVRWDPVNRVHIRHLPGRGEAEVTAVVRSADQFRRYRFWLIKENEAWKIFDFANMETSLRASSVFGRNLKRSSQGSQVDTENYLAREQLDRSGSLLNSGKAEEAIQVLDSLPGRYLSPTASAEREILRAYALLRLKKAAESLAAIEKALTLRKDMSQAIFTEAQILYRLERIEDSIRAAEAYIALVGPDAEACLWIAGAWDELGKPEAAAGIFERLLKEAPEMAEELPTVDGFKNFKDRPAIAEALKRARAKIPAPPK